MFGEYGSRDPLWLSRKVYDSYPGGPGFKAHGVHWVLRACSWARHWEIFADSKKKVYMRKVGDFSKNIYLNPDIFGTKWKANIHFIERYS